MNARRESKERNLTWRIQEDRNYWTLLEYFLDFISCILYVVLKLGKSEIQCFKRSMNQSWNEEVRAIESRSHQAEGKFRRLRSQPLAAKWCPSACEISQPSCMLVKSSWVLPDICDRHFLIFCFRYLMSKSQFSPCNPPIIGFLSY